MMTNNQGMQHVVQSDNNNNFNNRIQQVLPSINESTPASHQQEEDSKKNNEKSENDILFEEWKLYLQQTDRIDLLLVATEAITQLHTSLLIQCIQHNFIPLLVKHISYTDGPLEQVSVNALHALIYLSSTGYGNTNQCIHDLITIGKGMNRMIEIVLSSPSTESKYWNIRVNYAMALIANMTRTELGAIEFIGHTLPDTPIYHHNNTSSSTSSMEPTTTASTTTISVKPTLELLLNRFLNPKYRNDENINYNALLARDDDDDDDDDNNNVNDHDDHGIVPYNSNSNDNSNNTTTTNNTNTSIISSSSNVKLDSLDCDPYQHFAAILLNISSQTELGRQYILKIHHQKSNSKNSTTTTTTTNITYNENHNNTKEESNNINNDTSWSVLQLLLDQLRSRNPIRRRGIAGMIRNICQHERDSVWWLLNIVQINIHLLYPLAGPEELDYDDKQGLHVDLWIEGPDKIREPDHITRLFLVEAILFLLSTGRASRNVMRLQRTYVILKMADLVEEYEDVSAIISDCVNYLRRDEDGTVEGSSDALIEQTYQLKIKPESTDVSATTTTSITNNDDDDDFDNVD